MSVEEKKKCKAVEKLKMIAERAGEASSLMKAELSALGEANVEEIREMVLSSGAASTIEGHVRVWEKLEQFALDKRGDAAKEALYPPKLDIILQYALALDKSECGPAVIPALRSSVSWVCRRLSMDMPDLKSAMLLTLEAKVFEKRVFLRQ